MRTELYRSFKFASFDDAMAFIAAAVPHIARMDHHPRWENAWKSVSVWLSTWDAGHKPSMRDVRLAATLDQLYGTFPQPPLRNG